MSKAFPCPYCKGQGGGFESFEFGTYMTEPCRVCDTDGLIEIGGPVHQKMRAQKMVGTILDYFDPEGEFFYSLDALDRLVDDVEVLVRAARNTQENPDE